MLCHMKLKRKTVKVNNLQESLVDHELSGGEVKGAVLAQLSVPVLTPRPAGWIQIQRRGRIYN